jgi:hypothetical protein
LIKYETIVEEQIELAAKKKGKYPFPEILEMEKDWRATKDNPIEVINEGVELKRLINHMLEELITSFAENNYIKIDFEKALKRILFTY